MSLINPITGIGAGRPSLPESTGVLGFMKPSTQVLTASNIWSSLGNSQPGTETTGVNSFNSTSSASSSPSSSNSGSCGSVLDAVT